MTYPLVVVLGILVQPHFAQPYAVPLEHVHAAAPLVRRTFAEDVAHVRARHDFQGTWKQQLPFEFRSFVRSLQPIPRKRLIAGEKRMGNKFISPQTEATSLWFSGFKSSGRFSMRHRVAIRGKMRIEKIGVIVRPEISESDLDQI